MSKELPAIVPEKPLSELKRMRDAFSRIKPDQIDLKLLPHVSKFSWRDRRATTGRPDLVIFSVVSIGEFDIDKLNKKATDFAALLLEQGIDDMRITPAKKEEKGGMTFGWVEKSEVIGVDRISREIAVTDDEYTEERSIIEAKIVRQIRVMIFPSPEVAMAAKAASENWMESKGPRLESHYGMTGKEVRQFSKTSALAIAS